MLSLRPTMLSDLDFVLSVENDPRNQPFITPWERTQHEGAVRFPDFRHFIVEAGGNAASGDARDGFVILQGCRNPNRSVELKRLVLQSHGRGLGRACVRLLKRMAFRDLHAHRFWLDVKAGNARALALYASEGFVEEGRLRDSVRRFDAGHDAYDSLVVMSLLEDEYAARDAAALETAIKRQSSPDGRAGQAHRMPGTATSTNQEIAMADDKSKSGGQDRERIDIHEDYELRDWAKKFDVTPDQIKEAVAAVGTRAADVEMHLKGSHATTNADREAEAEGKTR